MPTLAFRLFLLLQAASLPSFDRKCTVQSVGNGHQSAYFRADARDNNINKTSKRVSVRGKYLKMHTKICKTHYIIKESHNYLLGNTIALIKSTFGTKISFFLVRSSLLPAVSSFWPKRSGITT